MATWSSPRCGLTMTCLPEPSVLLFRVPLMPPPVPVPTVRVDKPQSMLAPFWVSCSSSRTLEPSRLNTTGPLSYSGVDDTPSKILSCSCPPEPVLYSTSHSGALGEVVHRCE